MNRNNLICEYLVCVWPYQSSLLITEGCINSVMKLKWNDMCVCL